MDKGWFKKKNTLENDKQYDELKSVSISLVIILIPSELSHPMFQENLF